MSKMHEERNKMSRSILCHVSLHLGYKKKIIIERKKGKVCRKSRCVSRKGSAYIDEAFGIWFWGKERA